MNKTMKSRKLHHMEFFSPPPPPPPPEFPFPFQFRPTPPLSPLPPPPPIVCRFYPCFPPVIIVKGAPPTAVAHHHHRSLWVVGGGILAGVIAFLTIYNGLFTCRRNTTGMIKGIAKWITKREEGMSRRAARKTESDADAAELQQSASSTPEPKEEESQETEVPSTPESKPSQFTTMD